MKTTEVFAKAIQKMMKDAEKMEGKNPFSAETYFNDYVLTVFEEVKNELNNSTKSEIYNEKEQLFAYSYSKILKKTMEEYKKYKYNEQYIVDKIILPELKFCQKRIKEILEYEKNLNQNIVILNTIDELSYNF